jgi:imidazolonepropionase-like amidohydrolase
MYTDSALLEALRSLQERWRQQLGAASADLRSRPDPNTWSAIEYAAHTRDVTALHAYGVEQALTQDEPVFPPIRDDLAEAAAAAYADADPDEVLQALGVAAERLARLADDAGVEAWSRGLTVGETRSDVRRLLEHALHDSQHHLDDVERGLASLRTD